LAFVNWARDARWNRIIILLIKFLKKSGKRFIWNANLTFFVELGTSSIQKCYKTLRFWESCSITFVVNFSTGQLRRPCFMKMLNEEEKDWESVRTILWNDLYWFCVILRCDKTLILLQVWFSYPKNLFPRSLKILPR